jgi:hypothetical protein
MLGFKRFDTAAITISGIELAEKLRFSLASWQLILVIRRI